jgi:Zn-dependent protease with chaperone function
MTACVDHPLVVLPGISSRAWEHPADRSALVALRSLQGFDAVVKSLSGLLRERQHRLMYLSTAVRVDQNQFRSLDHLLADSVAVLDAETRPEMYVLQTPLVNAFTIGMDRPFIVLTTGLLELMSPEEVRFIIGHELGHALSGHAVYRTILMHLMRIADNLGWVPVGGWALRAILAALMEWQRKSELSGDRAGLLCGQDIDVALMVQLKLAGGAHVEEMNAAAFLAQAAEYESTGDLRDGVLKLLNTERQTHPFSVLRAAELKKWVDSGGYSAIIDGEYPHRDDDRRTSIGAELRGAAKTYRENFDQSQDPLVRTLRDVGGSVGSAASAVGQGVGEFASDVGRRFSNWRRSSDESSERPEHSESSDQFERPDEPGEENLSADT